MRSIKLGSTGRTVRAACGAVMSAFVVFCHNHLFLSRVRPPKFRKANANILIPYYYITNQVKFQGLLRFSLFFYVDKCCFVRKNPVNTIFSSPKNGFTGFCYFLFIRTFREWDGCLSFLTKCYSHSLVYRRQVP